MGACGEAVGVEQVATWGRRRSPEQRASQARPCEAPSPMRHQIRNDSGGKTLEKTANL